MQEATYEERFGRASRRLRRGWRRVRWGVRGALGRPRQVVVEVKWRLGDEVMALPIYGALRAAYPGCRLTALCNYPELLAGNPFVDAVNRVAGPVDRYILLRSAPRDVYRPEHYARLAGVRLPSERPRLYYDDWSTPLLDGLRPPLVAIAAGASWATKRWPSERWRAVGRALEEKGFTVIELGVAGEGVGVGVDLVGKTSVREAACVLHACDLLVCCDSGLMHLALAAGTRVLALFGPTDPAILVRDEPNLSALCSPAPCQGCWNKPETTAPPGVCPEGRPCCLESIATEAVLEQAGKLLG